MSQIIKNKLPAILGEKPAFKSILPLTVPDFPNWKTIKPKFKDIFKNEHILTKGKYLKELETQIAKYIGVKHAICISSCTSGLMLTYNLLKLKGEVILPSFSFMSTGIALQWLKNITPVFVDVDPNTFNIDPEKVRQAITPNTSAIVGVHIYGNPANIDELTNISKEHNIKLIFDSAHAFGSLYKNKNIGCFGDAEIFSLTPTKILIAGEGGIITTNNDKLAEDLTVAREYGNPGNYDSILTGMNARMSEFNAALGLESLKNIHYIVNKRNEYASFYLKNLSGIAGIKFQSIENDNISTYKDFTIVIEEDFELSRDQLRMALSAENIDTRCYFDPPLHLQTNFSEYKEIYKDKLPVTENLSKSVITIPLSSKYSLADLQIVVDSIHNIYENRKTIIEKTDI